jgi:Cu(I)/Ag(I) efflux system membrane fusion protein
MNNKIMKIKDSRFLKNSYLKYGIVLITGLLLGWLIFGGSTGNSASEEHDHAHAHEAEEQVWTCSMHPQIRMDKPGKCPLCAMDLIPVASSSGGDDFVHPDAIQMSKEAIALANVQTVVVSRQNPVKDIRLYGTIQIDERLSQSQTSHVSGRIEKLLINFTGESVKQGQTLAVVYSPDLMNAQQELLEALKMQSVQPALADAAREKLRFWKLTDEQIEEIEKSGNANPLIEIKANTNGVVMSKNVNQGDYINPGSVLLNVANLSEVWALFEAYETDLPFLKVGDKLDFTLQSIPGKTFSGKISFIDPLLDANTRTAKVRVVASNSGMQLKPGMYASAEISAPLKSSSEEIVIPKSAVLWTGKRSIVYVKQPNVETPAYLLREVELGSSLGGDYVVNSGIEEGEEIVVNGAFTIDATAQLEGKRSMMNTESGHEYHGHHDHSHHGHGEMSSQGTHAHLQVDGLCDMCKQRIEDAAKTVKGVFSAVWDKSAKELHFDYDEKETSVQKISLAIAAVGHDTELHKADDDVYEELHGCCKYRD